jgi:hypothetical protein
MELFVEFGEIRSDVHNLLFINEDHHRGSRTGACRGISEPFPDLIAAKVAMPNEQSPRSGGWVLLVAICCFLSGAWKRPVF